MNKIFIYARPCVNKDFFMITCSAVFSSLFLSNKYPKIDGNNEKLSRIFGIKLLATKTNSKSGEDVSQMIEPESLKTLP